MRHDVKGQGKLSYSFKVQSMSVSTRIKLLGVFCCVPSLLVEQQGSIVTSVKAIVKQSRSFLVLMAAKSQVSILDYGLFSLVLKCVALLLYNAHWPLAPHLLVP